MECRDAPRHWFHTLEAHTGENCTSCWTKHAERMIDAHGPTDSCRKCSSGLGNHSAECRQRFEKIQYDLLHEKLSQVPAIPEDSGEQTVVTVAPATREAEPGLAASSSSPSASAASLHRPGDPVVSE